MRRSVHERCTARRHQVELLPGGVSSSMSSARPCPSRCLVVQRAEGDGILEVEPELIDLDMGYGPGFLLTRTPWRSRSPGS